MSLKTQREQNHSLGAAGAFIEPDVAEIILRIAGLAEHTPAELSFGGRLNSDNSKPYTVGIDGSPPRMK